MNSLFNQFSKEELKETLVYINCYTNCPSIKYFKYAQKYKDILILCSDLVSNFKQLLIYYLENHSVPICKSCNKEGIYFAEKKLKDCCSKKCKAKLGLLKAKQTCLEKYNVDNPFKSEAIKKKIKQVNNERYGKNYIDFFKQKAKQTCLEKYGVENVYQSKEIKDKIKQTNLERHGVDHPLKSIRIKEKMKNTNIKRYGFKNVSQSIKIKKIIVENNLKKYGVKNPFQVDSIKDKYKQTCQEKYGSLWYSQSSTYKNKVSNKFLEKLVPILKQRNLTYLKSLDKHTNVLLKCNVCSNEFELNYNNQVHICCRKCNPYSRSKLESEIYDYLIMNNIVVSSNDRKTIKNKDSIKYLELDLFIPKFNLAIEINGVYYHSIKNENEDYLKKGYHLNKYNLCKEQNIKLLQFTDLDFINKPEICYSIINANLVLNQSKIFARKCSIQIVSNKESKDFLTNNHIQGYVNSSINLGLYFENNLVQIMTFGHSRFNKSYTYELIRLCSKLNHQVLGGTERLFKYFKENYLKSQESIISYCDISKFSGTVYSKLGFKEIEQSKPNYFYWKNGELSSRQKYQKHKLKNILENFNEQLTEKQNMLNNGYSIYYDCGNKVFLYS